MTPIAVTGLGIASALGIGMDDCFAALRDPAASAQTGRPLASFDASKRPLAPVVEVPDFNAATYLGDKGLRSLDRLTKLLLVAARLSLANAGIKKDGQWAALVPERVGVCCSNAYGSLEAITELDRVALLEDARYINPSKFPNTVSNSASGYVSIWEELRALNVSVSVNCGALDAVGCAETLLVNGRADAILTGGGEAMSEALFIAFDKLGLLAMTDGVARLGEGAAFLVLEPMGSARARGANVIANVIGYGTSFGAPDDDVTLLFASAATVERAAADAIADSGLAPGDIHLVVSGISGITRFDEIERAAIRALLGEGRAVAAPKRLFGETLGAGGALAMAAAIAWLDGVPKDALLSGTLPDRIDNVLVTSVGYYGNASAVVLRRA